MLITSLATILLLSIPADSRTLRRWTKKVISWTFTDPYHLLSSEQYDAIRGIVRGSFDEWGAALEGLVEFVEENEEDADINVFFAKKNHSCYEAFDGKGGVVAHSMYPPFGILHLDGDEEWRTRDKVTRDVDIRQVLIHEIGHTIGLRHSRQKASVMRKHYERTDKKHQLSKFDVRAVRKLYGAL